jgi:hypothetical protein
MEEIQTEWEHFAVTLLSAGESIVSAALRNQSKQILEAIAKDIETVQTGRQQSTLL